MEIRLATYADREKWDNYVMGHPDALAYQLFAWKEAVENAYSFNGVYLIAEEEGHTIGVLPLVDFRIPILGRTLISLPYCDVGGALADNEEAAHALLAYASTLAKEQKSQYCIRTTTPASGVESNQTNKVLMLMELPATSAQLEGMLKAKVRSQAKKPLRDGLTVKVGSFELIKEFYQVFAENMRSLGSPVHSRLWVDSIMSAYRDQARIAVVYTREGTPAAAGLVLIHSTTMSIPWASSLRQHNSLNPNMLLYWTFLNLAIEMGCRRFDFGRSTPGEGTYRFKTQWGASPKTLSWVTYPASEKSSSQNETNSGSRVIAEKIWRHMPLSVCNTLGPKLRRCINL